MPKSKMLKGECDDATALKLPKAGRLWKGAGSTEISGRFLSTPLTYPPNHVRQMVEGQQLAGHFM